MASSKEYLQFILGQLAELEEISYRTMMGEFIIYYCGKIVGGIYDDRLLVKPVKAHFPICGKPPTNCRMREQKNAAGRRGG